MTISRSVGRSIDCVNSGAATHCRLIFERLAYTRLVLKKFIARDCGAGGKERERERQRRRGEGGRAGLETTSIRLQMLSAKFKVPLSLTRTNVAN